MGLSGICGKCLLRKRQFSSTGVACHGATSTELTLESSGTGNSNLWD